MRSIIARVGGKSKIKNSIINLIPNHTIYVEPFVGGGAVFFGKEPSDIEIVNDLDKDIYYVYKDMKQVGEQMINKDFRPSKNKFERLKKQNKFNSKTERLYRNLFLSLNSFRANRKNYVGDKKEREKQNMNVGKIYKSTDYKDRLKDVRIENKDWKYIINKYDSKDTFFYLDPPYSMASDNNDYKNNDVTIDELFNTLKNIKGKFLLSYDYNNDIKNKFTGFKRRTIQTKYETAKNPIDKKEYLISNY
jgi:DNA adenine methylase